MRSTPPISSIAPCATGETAGPRRSRRGFASRCAEPPCRRRRFDGGGLQAAGRRDRRECHPRGAPICEATRGPRSGRRPALCDRASSGGLRRGALVTSFEGRPIKVEGNPRHPASLGATDVFAQAEILALYDPDRSQAIRAAGEISDWPAFELALRARLAAEAAGKGSGLRLLSGRVTSPTLLDQIEVALKAYPNMRWHVFEPTEDSDDDAAEAVYGKPLRLRPRFSEADAMVAFEADPLGCGPDQVRFGRELVDRRKQDRASFRFYAVECGMTLTGAFADHRLAAGPAAIEATVAALAGALGAQTRPELPREHARFIDAAAKDLRAAAGRGPRAGRACIGERTGARHVDQRPAQGACRRLRRRS